MAACELYSKHARVWLPHHQDVWQPAELTRNYTPGDKTLHVLLEDGTGVEVKLDPKTLSLPPLRNPKILVGENDLTALSYLHEPAVLHNLTVRFLDSRMIYTYCGIVLVAINPYESLPIYDVGLITAYSGQNMSDMDPHIFAVTEEAYRRMASDDRNQSIIVSGESGAGKTVSAKYAMRYFATVSGTSTESSIEQRVLASNPIMEAIGNAKTTRNDNSSRFGKYIQIGFDKKHHIIGANMRTYLLEKSRVVFQANRERNYHIFYQLCASSHLPEFKAFRLSGAEAFLCTNQGQSCVIDGVDDAKQLLETRNALSLLGISVVDQMALFQTLAAVLHLSNVEVVEQSADKSSISTEDDHLTVFSELTGVPRGDMAHWLCHRKLQTATETYVKPVSRADAVAGRDALAKALYSRLFSLVVDRVNHALMANAKTHSFIGILDIYGFETFDINSFEQFCINYANEKLQQQFNQHVFKLEQEEYMSENINWTLIDFYDNQLCISLIEDRMGILDLLDEECKMPKGSDVSWAQKLYNTLLKQNAAHFDKPRMSNTAFIIQHFADKVEYQCDGFLDKNKDTVNEEHINLLKTSKWDFLLVLLEDQAKTSSTPSPSSSSPSSTSSPSSSSSSSSSPSKAPRSGPAQRAHKKTVGLQFKQSLHMLMEILNSTTPHYIRCIKPNDDKAAFILNPVRVVQQLRACGILETIRISAAGFPSRWTYQEFFNRYRVLVKWKDVLPDRKQTCRNILANCLKDEEKYQFGKNKIFFRAGQVAYLEKLRSDALRAACVRIQKTIRCWLDRKKYLRMRRAAVTVQRYVRGHQARCLARFMRRTNAAVLIQQMVRMWLARKRYRRQRSAAISIQCCFRTYRAKQHYYKLVYENKAVVIQRYVRGWLARRRCGRYVGSVVLLQSCVRRWRALRELKRLKVEARSVEHFKTLNVGMENKIMQLQRKIDKQHKENVHLGERLVVAERHQGVQKDALLREMERLRTAEQEARATLEERLPSLLNEVTFLRHEAEEAKREKQDVEQVAVAYSEHAQQVVDQLNEEIVVLKGQKADLDKLVQEQKQKITDMEASVEHSKHVEKDLTETHSRYQSLMREHLELQEEMNLSKNTGRSDSFSSDITHSSRYAEGEDSSSFINKQDGDVSVLLKFQKRVKEVEQEKQSLQRQLDRRGSEGLILKEAEDQTSSIRAELDLEVLKSQDLDSDNRRLKRDLKELRESLSSSAATPPSPGSLPYSVLLEQLNSSSEELEMRKEEVLLLRSHMVHQEALKHKDLVLGEGLRLDHHDITSLQDFDRSTDLHTLNEDGELWLAYEGLKETNRVLEEQLQEQGASHREESEDLLEDMRRMKEENERQQELLAQSLMMSQEARVDAGLRHEITCLASDNLVLMEQREKQEKNLRKLYKQLKIYRKRVDELEARPQTSKSTAISPVNITRKEKDFKGMLEFQAGDEKRLVKHLVIDLRPRGVAVSVIPGLPAYTLFMCLRFVDRTDDPQRVSALLNATVSGIKHVIKRKGDDFETMSFWLANTCRFLHCIKQYSGKEVFSRENTARQNEHCLLNFELSEYEQVFSDLAARLYQQLCTCMEADLQVLIVSGMLEHDAVRGLMGSKPHHHSAAQRQRSSSSAQEDLTMESLLEQLNVFLLTLQNHGLQSDLVHQLTRQMFYLIGSVSLNHLLLRKDMCCWNTGLQIKYNVLQLEEWLSEKQLSDCGAKQTLEGLIQAAQLLQAKKNTQEDALAVGTICSVLTTAQIVRMLTLYTPVMEFEERVSHSFISNIQEILKDRVGSPLFLMDVKKVFPVSWTYTWSPVALDSIHIPTSLNLGFLNLV